MNPDGDVIVVDTGRDPRPVGNWQLVDYSWKEETGVAKLKYRRRNDPSVKITVLTEQPSTPEHSLWPLRFRVDHDVLLARHFETLRVTRELQRAGAYGR